MLLNAIAWQLAENGDERVRIAIIAERESEGDPARVRSLAAELHERTAAVRARGTDAVWLAPEHAMAVFGRTPLEIWSGSLDAIDRLGRCGGGARRCDRAARARLPPRRPRPRRRLPRRHRAARTVGRAARSRVGRVGLRSRRASGQPVHAHAHEPVSPRGRLLPRGGRPRRRRGVALRGLRARSGWHERRHPRQAASSTAPARSRRATWSSTATRSPPGPPRRAPR